ncbi:hypothetical protein F5X98DRAFT_344228 [Xylaria grammica]|nr:hypothetical protein F5X98DRAFT_344228 [Xylaria grammica]
MECLKYECMEVDGTSFNSRMTGIARRAQFAVLTVLDQKSSDQRELQLGLLKKYSALALTYELDRLPTLPGLAKTW